MGPDLRERHTAAIGGLFVTMLLFVGILLFGLAYAWRKGVLSWR